MMTRTRPFLRFVLNSCLLLVVVRAHTSSDNHDDHHHHERSLTGATHDRCGTVSPDPIKKLQLQQKLIPHQSLMSEFQPFESNPDQERSDGIVVPTIWHSIRKADGTEGITTQQIQNSMAVLNLAFLPAGFSFNLIETTTTNNDAYFVGDSNTDPAIIGMKEKLREGDSDTLNIYSNNIDQINGTLGIATFPWDYEEDPLQDGVVIGIQTTPGGSNIPTNEGDTLVHEVGHWLGLFHVFEGRNCSGDGDEVDDTPAQSEPTDGCPIGKDSCPSEPSLDSIFNYMDYSDDSCMFRFTNGQMARMFLHWIVYRQILPPITTPSPAPTETPTFFPTLSTPAPTASPTRTSEGIAPTSAPILIDDPAEDCFFTQMRCSLFYDSNRCCGYLKEIKSIFVTSTEFSADFMESSDLLGVTAADAICQSHASDAGHSGLFKAWIATDQKDTPRERFSRHKGKYVNAENKVVYKCWDDMVSGKGPENTFWLDEKGNMLTETAQGAATNLDEFGYYYENGELEIGNCKGWSYDETRGGDLTPSEAGIGVTEDAYGLRPNSFISCNQMVRLICVEQ